MKKIETETNNKVMSSSTRLPVFQLPIFLLAGGAQRLRIFEQKYISMVTNATHTNGFVISPFWEDKATPYSEWGCHVQIIDFDQGDDGILTIDVLASNLVKISDFRTQSDGLLTAKAELLPHWSQLDSASDELDDVYQSLSKVLEQLFKENEALNKLYKNQYFNYSQWVAGRLLETIPLGLVEKEKFVQHYDFKQLTVLLSSLLQKYTKNE